MKIPEYKLKWLEKQLELYDEQEHCFFENYDYVSATILDQYLKNHPELETEPILLFLKEYVNKTIQKYKQYSSKEALLFDASAHNVCDFTVCVAWCIDMLQAYDKWRESEAMC